MGYFDKVLKGRHFQKMGGSPSETKQHADKVLKGRNIETSRIYREIILPFSSYPTHQNV